MTNLEFLSQLESELMGKLSQDEVEEVLRYHEEYFAEAGEDAASKLDPPRVIAQRVLEEYRQRERAVHKKAAGWIVGAVAIAVIALTVGLGVRSGVRNLVRGIFGYSGVFTTVETRVPEPVEVAPVEGSAEVPVGVYWEEGTRIRGIHVDIDYGDVTIQSGEEYCIDLYRDLYQDWNYYVDSNDVLYITANRTQNLPDNKDSDAKVTLTVPEGQSLVDVGLWLNCGNAQVRGIESDNLYVSCNMGKIDLTDLKAGDVNCEADMGDISLTNVASENDFTCQADMGKISGDSIFGSSIVLTADMGAIDVTLAGHKWEYNMELCTDMGVITVEGNQQLNRDIGVGSDQAKYSLTARANLGAVTVNFTEN